MVRTREDDGEIYVRPAAVSDRAEQCGCVCCGDGVVRDIFDIRVMCFLLYVVN